MSLELQAHQPPTIEQVVDHIFASRRITRDDQRCFMSTAMRQGSLSQIEEQLVNRVFEALSRGLLRVVD